MRRRQFIASVGGAAATWPLAVSAQPPAIPVIGYLSSASDESRVEAFRRGLAETGFAENRTVAIEYRFADGHYDRLPSLAADLVRRPVSVLATSGITATRAAKAATATIPIVFNTGGDPVELGLVASLARPGGNLTGVATLGKVLVAKQMELLHELVPGAASLAFLVNPSNAVAQAETSDAQAVARARGLALLVVEARSERELEPAFAAVRRQGAGALLMQADPFLSGARDALVALAARYGVATVSPFLEFARGGGLLSYGSSVTDALRLVGTYSGRILKGEKPADLPVQQAVKVELVVNLATAKALGLTIPTAVVLRADEVVE